jgi:hypothetical protein
MPYINPNTLDNGLTALKAAADRVFINSSEPATYAAASAGGAYLGVKTFAAGGVFPGAIATNGTGRELATAAITDGTVAATGTASHWSVGTSGSTRLETAQALSATQSVTLNNQFSLASTTVRLAGAA